MTALIKKTNEKITAAYEYVFSKDSLKFFILLLNTKNNKGIINKKTVLGIEFSVIFGSILQKYDPKIQINNKIGKSKSKFQHIGFLKKIIVYTKPISAAKLHAGIGKKIEIANKPTNMFNLLWFFKYREILYNISFIQYCAS